MIGISSTTRIQWLHKKIQSMAYPNAQSLSEKFRISRRQAQRDIEYLRDQLGAPLAYLAKKRGYYYLSPYALPSVITTQNDETMMDDEGQITTEAGDKTVIQLQIPYTATLEIKERIGVIELNRYIRERKMTNRYECEFHSIDHFLAAVLAVHSDVTILTPGWLRDRLVEQARRVIRNNADLEED